MTAIVFRTVAFLLLSVSLTACSDEKPTTKIPAASPAVVAAPSAQPTEAECENVKNISNIEERQALARRCMRSGSFVSSEPKGWRP
jgi:entry exclusion lipoprotein TrbK